MINILDSKFVEEEKELAERFDYFSIRSLFKEAVMIEYINSQPEIHWCGEVEE